MRKFAIVSVLILVAYIAGAGYGTDDAVAFVAPAVPCVTAAGGAIWSVVAQVMEFGPQSANTSDDFSFITIVRICLIVGVVWAACCIGNGFQSGVKSIWNELPKIDGKRSIPVWAIVIIPFVAFVEFFAKVFYFAGFTIVALTYMPLKSVFTFDLRLLSSKKGKDCHA